MRAEGVRVSDRYVCVGVCEPGMRARGVRVSDKYVCRCV